MESLTARDWLGLPLLLIGVAFMFLGALGLVRMPDVYMRMQAASKTSTLGLWAISLAVAVHFAEAFVVTRALAVIVLASLTVPVAAQAVARAAHRARAPVWPGEVKDELKEHEARTARGRR